MHRMPNNLTIVKEKNSLAFGTSENMLIQTYS